MKEEKPKIFVVFYSMYGYIFRMANAVVEGVREAGGEPILEQVAELVPEEFWNDATRKAKELLKNIPVADPGRDLKGIDGVIVGTPTRFGNMCSQMRNFWDQTGGDWMEGMLIGKPAAVFTSSAFQHGGLETTITMSMITGDSPYGPSTIAGMMGERMPSANELKMAKDLGKHLATIARRLSA